MTPSTWKALDDEYQAFPILMAGPVPASEVAAVSRSLGLGIPEDYANFLVRYGSAIVGPYPIFGLRRIEPMGTDWSVIEMNRRFRADGWPGVEEWVLFSQDLGGNPIGLSRDGHVWLSDHDHGGTTEIAPTFEAFLLQALGWTDRRLYTLEGPLCAIDQGGARTTTECDVCGRAVRRQTGTLSVALACPSRSVWLTDSNAVLVRETLSTRLSGMAGLRMQRVHAHWRGGIPSASQEVPVLVQMRADYQIHTPSSSLESRPCACGSVRAVPFDPLVVLDDFERAAVWYLAESPEVLVVNDDVRAILVSADPDLEFAEVRVENGRSARA